MIEHFGTIYIEFNDYSPYSGAISENFVTNINAHIQYNHVFPYSTIQVNMLTYMNKERWEMMKKCFPEAKQVKKFPRTTVYKMCKYVQNERK